ncbi:MAG: 23S rRNA (guanosine(2251)-2'-O)-methyltransferase RlmB, partial [Gammaproteobacteria bacterium]|nr:23S rRNA (guanosine(2251)-2'-O)-methyltransferase RlmB [Gammaproteobacteria bacterium]
MSNYVFGLHTVSAVLEKDAAGIGELWLQKSRKDSRLERIARTARKTGVIVQTVERRILDQMVPDARHQGVVAAYQGVAPLGESDLDPLLDRVGAEPLVLVLDGVQDPHNLGACLRTADAAGVDVVIVPRDRAVGLTPVVRKVSCGAAETVPFVQVTNLARVLRQLRERGLLLVGLAGEAETNLFDTELLGAMAIIMGGEGSGLRRLTRKHC